MIEKIIILISRVTENITIHSKAHVNCWPKEDAVDKDVNLPITTLVRTGSGITEEALDGFTKKKIQHFFVGHIIIIIQWVKIWSVQSSVITIVENSMPTRTTNRIILPDTITQETNYKTVTEGG